MQVDRVEVESVLTRAGGYLKEVCSHSLQPYRGCSYGRALCGIGCYVRHSPWVTRGREWGTFLEARVNAAEVYRRQHPREAAWGRRARGRFGVFLSSATDPFVPQERRLGITRAVLEAMVEQPPDTLVLQTHSHRVGREREILERLAAACELRVQLSVESDRDRLPGLPPPASTVTDRLAAAAELRRAGLFVVITVAPLLPIDEPRSFFARIAECADAVVIDHFLGGDGSPGGSRTRRTGLPAAMAVLDPSSVELAYRDRMVEVALRHGPKLVGVSAEGFAGRWL